MARKHYSLEQIVAAVKTHESAHRSAISVVNWG